MQIISLKISLYSCLDQSSYSAFSAPLSSEGERERERETGREREDKEVYVNIMKEQGAGN